MPGPLRVQLCFGVGRADEPFARGGITHVVEHLALGQFHDVPFAYNGVVGADLCVLGAEGDEDELTDFLAGCCAALGALPLDRLDAERRVLRTEAAQRVAGMVTALLFERFGFTGWGLLGTDEHGLAAATDQEVQAWARQRFVVENAVLVCSGPPPRGLRLPLAQGPRPPAPTSVPVAQELPTLVRRPSRSVGLGGMVRDGVQARALARHLSRRLHTRLRTTEGVTYSVSSSCDSVAPGQHHVTAAADALAEHAAVIATAMVEEVDRLCDADLDADEVLRDIDALRRAAAAAEMRVAAAMRRARVLLGREDSLSPGDAVRQIGVQGGAGVAGAARDLRGSAWWIAPVGAVVPGGRFHDYRAFSAADVAGRAFARRAPTPDPDQAVSLVVGGTGVSIHYPQDRRHTVEWTRCVGLLAWSTGERSVIGADGFGVHISPPDWEQVAEIRATVDAAVAAELVVPMGPMVRPPTTAAPRRSPPQLNRMVPIPFVALVAALVVIAIRGAGPSTPATPAFSLPPGVVFSLPAPNRLGQAIVGLPLGPTAGCRNDPQGCRAYLAGITAIADTVRHDATSSAADQRVVQVANRLTADAQQASMYLEQGDLDTATGAVHIVEQDVISLVALIQAT